MTTGSPQQSQLTVGWLSLSTEHVDGVPSDMFPCGLHRCTNSEHCQDGVLSFDICNITIFLTTVCFSSGKEDGEAAPSVGHAAPGEIEMRTSCCRLLSKVGRRWFIDCSEWQ